MFTEINARLNAVIEENFKLQEKIKALEARKGQMKPAHKHRVILFELKKQNADVEIRKRMNLDGKVYFKIAVRNYDGSYEIGQNFFGGTHICRVIMAIRLMILAARECNWGKYHPVVRSVLELDKSEIKVAETF